MASGECARNPGFMLATCPKNCAGKGATPMLLRGAAKGWRPYEAWDGAGLSAAAGDDEVEVAVVERAGSFEVHPDRIERPPKSTMRIADLVRLMELRTEANLTLYTRQARLWSMPSLLRDMAPLPWMEHLDVRDLNIWLGDGHFRNTLHYDPFDNFLCQVRGTKHLLLFPPDARDALYFAKRRDIQAHYEPGRGEYGRRDTGIVSDNTAEVNGAAPDLLRFPRYAHAQSRATSCTVQPGDCLYLPQGVHHHVFSEPDATLGFNLAINIWVYRPGEGNAHRPAGEEAFTLDRLQALLAADGKDEL